MDRESDHSSFAGYGADGVFDGVVSAAACELGLHLTSEQARKTGVVGDERELPPDGGGGDLQVADMLLLMEWVLVRARPWWRSRA